MDAATPSTLITSLPPASATPKTAKAGASRQDGTPPPSSAYAKAREDLALRFTSKDGDVLEIRAGIEAEAGYTRGSGACAPASEGVAPEAAAAEGTYAPGDAAEWVRQVKKELGEQQARLFETLLKGYSKPGEGGFKVVDWGAGAAPEEGGDPAPATDPDYWNAENTSDRIVAFATGFAALHGEDPEAFATQITQAVLDGFDQAHSITGDMPGEAGAIFKETKQKTFAKLEKWLEDWRGGAYNREVQTPQDPQATT